MSLNNKNYNHKTAFKWVGNNSQGFFPLKKPAAKPRNTTNTMPF